jgi:hypothetical protein
MDYAAAVVKLCWGEILKLSTGCFWDISSPEWAQWLADGNKAPTSPSYCHPWSSGVTHWLTESFAGLMPQQAGFRTFVATPHVSRLHPRVRATRHTPHGPLSIRAELRNTSIEVVIDAGIDGVVGLRRFAEGSNCVLDVASVTLDGREAASELTWTVEAPRLHPSVLGQHVFVGVRANGRDGSTRHVVRASYTDGCGSTGTREPVTRELFGDSATLERLASVEAPPASSLGKGLPTIPPFAAPSYPARWTLEKGGGDWLGRRGSAGYVLFAFDGDGKDVQRVPSWVAPPQAWLSPPLAGHSKSRWVGADAGNATYLQDPQNFTRALGWATSSANYFGADGSQGTVIDVNVTTPRPWKLSVYFVGGVIPNETYTPKTHTATKQAIRVMDLATLDPIAPEPLIELGFGESVYWVLSYDKGVRLRCQPIDGDSGFAAVFFDLSN